MEPQSDLVPVEADTGYETTAGSYGNLEEKRVITGIEANVLNAEGLQSRTTHDSDTFTVASM
jgi:hypothetical protein